jgi:hypothetical protein
MPLTSISGVYDGKEIRPLEPMPVESPYLVVITFLTPASDNALQLERERRFWESFGAWSDERTTEDILADIHVGLSKPDAPAL